MNEPVPPPLSTLPPYPSPPPYALVDPALHEQLRPILEELEERKFKIKKAEAVLRHSNTDAAVNRSSTRTSKQRTRELRGKVSALATQISATHRASGIFKTVCSTDLLFIVDATSSMWLQIDNAKTQIKSIVQDIREAFFNDAEVRVAVVAYRDHSEEPNIEFLDFTTDTNKVYSFLGTLKATGGDDVPEDVLGGIDQVVKASWKNETRCCIHILDAPPHGRVLQNPTQRDCYPLRDSWPEAGSEPHCLTYEPLMQQLIERKINYALLRINNMTDTMAYKFFLEYQANSAVCKLHPDNRFSSDKKLANSTSRGSGSKGKHTYSLLFEEAKLGTSYSALKHLVLRNVTTSASLSAVRSLPRYRGPRSNGLEMADLNLATIGEDESDNNDVALEECSPDWTSPTWFEETLEIEGLSPETLMHSTKTLDAMMASDENIGTRYMELSIVKRSLPFAEGALRRAFYAKTKASSTNYVVKVARENKKLADVVEEVRCQTLCKAFAMEFNTVTKTEHPIAFVTTTCFRTRTEAADSNNNNEWMLLEPFIPGAYRKYNSNSGGLSTDHANDKIYQTAQAFSHFTFERSQGKFLICDLQGAGTVLTDPVIHTRDPMRFPLNNKTNLGEEGIKFFFLSHQCNRVCFDLGLKSNAATVRGDNCDFRTRWVVDWETFCCENKLCGKVLSEMETKRVVELPGHRWCDSCVGQLLLKGAGGASVERVCSGPGERHKFSESRFWLESQGLRMPSRCARHR